MFIKINTNMKWEKIMYNSQEHIIKYFYHNGIKRHK